MLISSNEEQKKLKCDLKQRTIADKINRTAIRKQLSARNGKEAM